MNDPTSIPLSSALERARLSAEAERLGLRLVLRFGSRAERSRLSPVPESDLDIAVLAHPARRVEMLELYEAMSRVFPEFNVDVAILNDADPLFLDEVYSVADLLYGDLDLFAERQCHAYRSFTESADLRGLERALSQRKLDKLLHHAT